MAKKQKRCVYGLGFGRKRPNSRPSPNNSLKIAENFNIPVIEDCAQAIGAECKIDGQKRCAGSIGDFGCFSFY